MKGGLLLRITTTTKTLSKEAIPSASTHITQSRALVYTRNMQHTRAEVSVVPWLYSSGAKKKCEEAEMWFVHCLARL